MLKYLLEKEFKTVFRDSFMLRLIIVFPIMVMTVLPWAATLEIKNIKLTVVDNDDSPYSQRLTDKAAASGYFRFRGVAESYDAAMYGLEKGHSDIILEIPDNFEKELVGGMSPQVLISANTVNGTKGALGSNYLSRIVLDFSDELRAEEGIARSGNEMPVIASIPQYKFNQTLNYQVFMVPALLVILLTLSCGFLPAQNIVSEKEAGTIEQMNVTPVGKFQFILAKLIPYWVIGFATLTAGFGIAYAEYGLVFSGSILTIYAASLLYVFAISGFGLIVSNTSETLQQAIFVMVFFIIVFILMSGLFTPVASMPGWAQTITVFNPLTYFIKIMRFVYLKGSGIADLKWDMLALAGFAVVFNVWAVLSYRKSK